MSTWIEDIEKILVQYKGKAPFPFLYDKVLQIRDLKKNENVEEIIKETLNKNDHIFENCGSGRWALISYGKRVEKIKLPRVKKIPFLSLTQIKCIEGYYETLKNSLEVMNQLDDLYEKFETDFKPKFPAWFTEDKKAEIQKHKNDRLKLNTEIKNINRSAERFGLQKFEEYLITKRPLLGYRRDLNQSGKEITGAALIQLKEQINTIKKLPTSSFPSDFAKSDGRYIACKDCGVKLNVKNANKHKRKCIVVNKEQTKNDTLVKYQNNHDQPNKTFLAIDRMSLQNPAIAINDSKRDYKQERELDGSRDYYKIREQGKFGSHSVYDDMNDEANP